MYEWYLHIFHEIPHNKHYKRGYKPRLQRGVNPNEMYGFYSKIDSTNYTQKSANNLCQHVHTKIAGLTADSW